MSIDLTGKTFGQLTVLRQLGRKQGGSWLCQCSCGAERKHCAAYLTGGKVVSCGCAKPVRMAAIGRRALRHGHGNGSRTYKSWSSMIARCDGRVEVNAHLYKGRGITVCERWRTFDNFLADMGERPEGTTIDRIDNNGNYEPGNCRWATWIEQAANRRNNRLLTFNGDTKNVSEWARAIGIGTSTLLMRVRAGWSDDQALSRPVRKLRSKSVSQVFGSAAP